MGTASVQQQVVALPAATSAALPQRARCPPPRQARQRGRSERFQRGGVEEKRHDADEGDAVTVGPGFFVGVAGHDDLPEVVADVAERKGFLFALFIVRNVPC